MNRDNESGNPAGATPNVNQPYPYPQPITPTFPPVESGMNAYPDPGYPQETKTIPKTDYCAKVDTWVEYTNTPAQFSFQYPAESEIHESVDPNGYPVAALFLRPGCYVNQCWGPNKVVIAVLLNPGMLSLEDFVVDQFTFDLSTDRLALSQELANSSQKITVDGVTGIQVNGKITREAPHVYLPYNDHVIFVGLTETSHMPPFAQPCPATLDLFDKILASVRLQER